MSVVGLRGRRRARSPSSPARPSAAPAEDLARRVEERHRSARDLTARFVQTYRSGLLGRESSSGALSLKRPGRMRWEYEAPEKKTFVSDGKRSTSTCPPTAR